MLFKNYLAMISLILAVPFPLKAEAINASYSERLFDEGTKTWLSGRQGDSRTYWIRLITYCGYNPSLCSGIQLKQAREYIEKIPTQKREEEPGFTPPLPAKPSDQPKKIKKQTPQKTKPNATQQNEHNVDSLVSINKLINEAERARERGQLEHALNLYRMAEKINPQKEEFFNQIKEISEAVE